MPPAISVFDRFFLEQNIFDLLGVNLPQEQKDKATLILAQAAIHKAMHVYLATGAAHHSEAKALEQKIAENPSSEDLQAYILEKFPDFMGYVEKASAAIKREAFIQQLKDIHKLLLTHPEEKQSAGMDAIFKIERQYIDGNLDGFKQALQEYKEFKLKHGL